MHLEVKCHIRPSRWFVWCGLPLYRYFQLGAFHAGYENLLMVAGEGGTHIDAYSKSSSSFRGTIFIKLRWIPVLRV